MATPRNLEQGAGRHLPGFCGNRGEHGPSSLLMAPMACEIASNRDPTPGCGFTRVINEMLRLWEGSQLEAN